MGIVFAVVYFNPVAANYPVKDGSISWHFCHLAAPERMCTFL